ncbi:MAG: four helix bundle protein, partial [Cyanobacteria bacterium J06600_6]
MSENVSDITIQERTEKFAVRVINAYTEINRHNHFDNAARILSKQFLRSGTSIGANVAESIYAQSHKDFIHKYSISLKEASETKYWIKIMIQTQIVPENKFLPMLDEIQQIIRILI